MKTTRGWAVLAAVVAVGAVWGQSIDYVIISKQRKKSQTGATTWVNTTPDPWAFQVQLHGSGQSASFPAQSLTILRPGSSTPDALVFKPEKGTWDFYSEQPSITALDAAFPSGDYVLGVGSSNYTLTLTGNLYPNPPSPGPVTLGLVSAGMWAGGGQSLLRLTAAEAAAGFTFGTNTYAGFVADGTNRIDLSISGYGGATYSQSANTASADSLSMAVPGGALSPGSQYRFEVDFARIMDTETITDFGGSTLVGTVYTGIAHFTVEVIPEPAAVASWIGAAALASVLLLRRRGGRRAHSSPSK
jgi:hypothetical protein